MESWYFFGIVEYSFFNEILIVKLIVLLIISVKKFLLLFNVV